MFDRPLPPSRRYREQQREYREAQRQKRQQRLDALHDDRGRKRARPGACAAVCRALPQTLVRLR